MQIRIITSAVFLVCLSIACSNPKTEDTFVFDDFYKLVLDHRTDDIYNGINKKSRSYIDAITNVENQNMDSIEVVGKKYKVTALSYSFYLDTNSKGIKEPAIEDFFRYLALSDCNLFSIFSTFLSHEKENRIEENENFIAYWREIKGVKRISWLKTNKSGEVDLLYTLNNYSRFLDNERKQKQIQKGRGARKAYYQKLEKTYPQQNPFDTVMFRSLLTERKTKLEKMKKNFIKN